MTTRSPNNRLMKLLDLLDRIEHAHKAEDAEVSMTDFAFDLLPVLKDNLHEVVIFNKGDESLLKDLEANGAATSILIRAMSRFMGQASPEFYNSACISLVHLAFQSKERSIIIYKQGGLACILKMMQCYRSVDFVQIIGVAALMVIGKNMGISTFELDAVLLQQIVLAMEWHQESSRVYIVACSALGTLFGPGSRVIAEGGDDENNLYHRALSEVTYGMILHLDDQVAQGVGHGLLCNMVGPDVAEEMIQHVENSHGGDCCAAAA